MFFVIGMGNLELGLYCLLVSLLWGCTNPLIKHSTKDITKIKTSNTIAKIVQELKYLALNWKYVLLFLTNQVGSLLYFVVLQFVDLSLIVPVVNALTFLITGVVEVIIGESTPTLKTLFGILLILTGITFCVLDKIY